MDDQPPLPYRPGATTMRRLGLETAQPREALTFPDGGAWRVEIPSVEGPRALEAVIEEARHWQVPVHRVSQGSGVTMLTDGEIIDMVQASADVAMELCLFARPGADWDIGGAQRTPAGSSATRSRGTAQLGAALAEIERGVGLGVRSFLVADEGLLWSAHRLRERGDLPRDLQLKVSVMSAPTNPASFAVSQLLGADTINVPSDLTVAQLAELRATTDATVDFYVEAPDGIGGFVRYHEIHAIVRAAAPLYLKFGLRNAPDVYPAGAQLEQVVLSSVRERVRRARLGLDELARDPAAPAMSPIGSREQRVLERFSTERLSTEGRPS